MGSPSCNVLLCRWLLGWMGGKEWVYADDYGGILVGSGSYVANVRIGYRQYS